MVNTVTLNKNIIAFINGNFIIEYEKYGRPPFLIRQIYNIRSAFFPFLRKAYRIENFKEILIIFVFFHEFARFFENSKKKYVQELLALTFHGIAVVKNFHNARRISKFVFSGLSYFDQYMNSEKHEFCDSALIVEVFDYRNAVKS